MAFTIDRLDHLVITVRDLEACCAFYVNALGMRLAQFGDGRTALHFGNQKINVHIAGREFEPKARLATPGSADLCFITASGPQEVLAQLAAAGVTVELGPVTRQGALGRMTSVYCRDPDGNLIEIASY